MGSQRELLEEESGWKVVNRLNAFFGNSKWPIYVKTVPLQGIGDQPTDVLPWEQ